jgi:hypothetical protein
MCIECIPFNKNHAKQLHDSTESKNKEVDSEDFEQVLEKT